MALRLWLLATCLLPLVSTGCKKPAAPAQSSTNGTHAWFEDITERSGLNFVHATGTNFFMPDQMGSGGALFDYDNDGRLDIYLVQNAGPKSRRTNQLFHQEPDGRFKDVSAGSGLDVAGHGMGVAVGDVNNDGGPDLVLTEYGAVRLFLNQGNGVFKDITQPSGLDNPRWSTAAAFFDYDRDGWLDLVVANYLDYDPTQKCYDAKRSLEFCGPHEFPGLVTRLFRNLGANAESSEFRVSRSALAETAQLGTPNSELGTFLPVRFEDTTVKSGLARVPGPALGVLCADFDGDRWPDIFLADDGKPNRLFVNQRNGTFKEEAALRGLAYNAMGQTAGNMGIAIGDADGDGAFDIFVTHLTEELHGLWMQGPRGVFQDRTAVAGLTNQRWRGTGFGTALADFDHDGALDLAFVNGLVKRAKEIPSEPGKIDPFWIPYAQRNQLFVNNGQGKFRDVSLQNATFCGKAMVGRGLACGDIDNDGAIDLLVTSIGAPAQLLRNTLAGGATTSPRGHWLMVRAIDPALGGRDAYGAEITLQAGGRRWWRLLHPAYSYLCSSDPRVHFGLGTTTRVDSIQAIWPDGTEENFPGSAADSLLVLRKGSGRVEPE